MNALPSYLRRTVDVIDRFDERLDLMERMQHYCVPGIEIAVVEHGEMAAAETLGVSSKGHPLTTNTRFQAGSVSKPLTTVAALRLAEQGRLDLDADVNQQLRSWKIPPHQFPGEVTLRRLLSHSAGTSVTGFPGYPRGSTIPSTRQVLDGQLPANTAPVRVIEEPGINVRYSGGGFTIIQQLIEDATGRSFADALHELVLQPSGMNDSTFKQELSSATNDHFSNGHLPDGTEVLGGHHVYPEQAAAGLWTTASDLARFAISLVDSWSGSGALLSKDAAREMLSPQAGIYGLGMRIGRRSEKSIYWHTGGAEGFRAHLRFSTDGRGVVGLANGDDGMSLINEVFEGLYDESGRLAPDRRTVRVAAIDTVIYEGHYEYRFEAFSHSLSLASENGTIEATAPTLWHGTRQWLPEDRDQFIAPDGGTPITFHFNASHQVQSLDWGSYRFEKAR